MDFDIGTFYGFLIQGNLQAALSYLAHFPAEAPRLARYTKRFEKRHFITYPVCAPLQTILLAYQHYYRNVFFLNQTAESAAAALYSQLAALPECQQASSLDILEESILPAIFQSHGLSFMGGKTGGFYGPYVWGSTDEHTYQVALPFSMQNYRVRLCRRFISKSWLDYISFGEISTGGWTDKDGIISCIADCYDTESEAFQVSLLKHEAQHAQDLLLYPNMCQDDLEYRAKLVELIYSQERDLLHDFRQQAGHTDGHSRAASRIGRELAGVTSRSEIPSAARKLLEAHNDQMKG